MSDKNGYLILTRKAGEAHHFHTKDSGGSTTKSNITFTEGSQTRLSISAPPSVNIIRGKLLEP